MKGRDTNGITGRETIIQRKDKKNVKKIKIFNKTYFFVFMCDYGLRNLTCKCRCGKYCQHN